MPKRCAISRFNFSFPNVAHWTFFRHGVHVWRVCCVLSASNRNMKTLPQTHITFEHASQRGLRHVLFARIRNARQTTMLCTQSVELFQTVRRNDDWKNWEQSREAFFCISLLGRKSYDTRKLSNTLSQKKFCGNLNTIRTSTHWFAIARIDITYYMRCSNIVRSRICKIKHRDISTRRSQIECKDQDQEWQRRPQPQRRRRQSIAFSPTYRTKASLP